MEGKVNEEGKREEGAAGKEDGGQPPLQLARNDRNKSVNE